MGNLSAGVLAPCAKQSAATAVCHTIDSAADRPLTRLTLRRDHDKPLGVRIADTESTETGVMIIHIYEGGEMSRWNSDRPLGDVVAVGDSIVEVNGLRTPWEIMGEMVSAKCVELTVRHDPPHAELFLQQYYVTDQSLKNTALILNRTVRARDVTMDCCSICMDDVLPSERIAALQCGHGFHQDCLSQWMGCKEDAECPLCRGNIH